MTKKRWFWELSLLGTVLLLCYICGSHSATHTPFMQAFAYIMLVVAQLCLTIIGRPFVHPLVNLLMMSALIVLITVQATTLLTGTPSGRVARCAVRVAACTLTKPPLLCVLRFADNYQPDLGQDNKIPPDTSAVGGAMFALFVTLLLTLWAAVVYIVISGRTQHELGAPSTGSKPAKQQAKGQTGKTGLGCCACCRRRIQYTGRPPSSAVSPQAHIRESKTTPMEGKALPPSNAQPLVYDLPTAGPGLVFNGVGAGGVGAAGVGAGDGAAAAGAHAGAGVGVGASGTPHLPPPLPPVRVAGAPSARDLLAQLGTVAPSITAASRPQVAPRGRVLGMPLRAEALRRQAEAQEEVKLRRYRMHDLMGDGVAAAGEDAVRQEELRQERLQRQTQQRLAEQSRNARSNMGAASRRGGASAQLSVRSNVVSNYGPEFGSMIYRDRPADDDDT